MNLYLELLFSSEGFFFHICTVGFVMLLLLNSSLLRTSPKSHKLFAWSYDVCGESFLLHIWHVVIKNRTYIYPFVSPFSLSIFLIVLPSCNKVWSAGFILTTKFGTFVLGLSTKGKDIVFRFIYRVE